MARAMHLELETRNKHRCYQNLGLLELYTPLDAQHKGLLLNLFHIFWRPSEDGPVAAAYDRTLSQVGILYDQIYQFRI